MKSKATLAIAMLIASPTIFATQDNTSCDANMHKLKAHEASGLNYLGDEAEKQIKGHIRLAKEAQQAGDGNECFLQSSKALQEIEGVGEAEGIDSRQ